MPLVSHVAVISLPLLLMLSLGLALPRHTVHAAPQPRHAVQQATAVTAAATAAVTAAPRTGWLPQLLRMGSLRSPSATRQLLGDFGPLTQIEFIVVVICSVIGLLLIVALVLMIVLIVRRTGGASVSPMNDPAVLQDAANQVVNAAVAQLAAQNKLPPPAQTMPGMPPTAAGQKGFHQGMSPPTPGQKEFHHEEFSRQQDQFNELSSAPAAPLFRSPARGPAIEAAMLVQRLINSGQPEAAMAVASAAGLNPGSLGGGSGYGMPTGQQMPMPGQRGPSLPASEGQQPMVPYAPQHTLYS